MMEIILGEGIGQELKCRPMPAMEISAAEHRLGPCEEAAWRAALPVAEETSLDLWQDMLTVRGQPILTPASLAKWQAMDYAAFSVDAAKSHIFLNDQMFEVSIANTPTLLNPLLDKTSAQ
jgi:hypothetical protein